jgi:hypothetical protein
MSRRSIAAGCAASAAAALGLWASAASAAYNQCPPVGKDTGCQFLVTITDAGPTVAQDTAQPPYEGVADSLVGIQNNSSHLVQSISLAASNGLFNFDGDGLCNSGSGPAPAGCQPPPGSTAGCNPSTANTNHCSFAPPPGEPAGYTEPNARNYSEETTMTPVPAAWPNGDLQNGYEGPRTWFSNVAGNANSGVVNLSPPLAPGESTYFSVEQPNSAVTAVANVPTVSTAIKLRLTGDGESGTRLIVPQGVPVTNTASVSGASAAAAGGTVNYRVFRDKACAAPVGAPSSAAVSKGAVAPSAPITLAPGTYYLQATYNGDPVNSPSASPCGAAVLIVAQRFNSGLPSTRACLRSSLQFHARKPKALRSVTLGVDINGRLIKRVKVAGKRRPLTTIRKLPSGRFRVAVIGIAGNGSAYEDERQFRRCGK